MAERLGGGWHGVQGVVARQYICGFCGPSVASERGWPCNRGDGRANAHIYVCPLCNRPTFFEETKQIPGVPIGDPVKSLPADIESIYNEARICCSASAFTAAVLLLRKLLMNVAVNLAAPEGKKFIEYVEYLGDKGYVPPHGKAWVDHVRKKGNEANHEITLMNKTDAEELIVFSEMLLKFIYEFPKRVPQTPITP